MLIWRRLFLLKSGIHSIFCGKKLDYLHLKDFLKYECELYLSNYWVHNARSLLPIAPRTIDLSFKLDDGRVISISRDSRLCHFYSYNAIENEAHFVLEWPLSNPIGDKFSSQFENVVPKDLKFFQVDQQVNISLYLTEATTLHHSKELTSLKPSWSTFSPISLFGFPDFKINFNSFQSTGQSVPGQSV